MTPQKVAKFVSRMSHMEDSEIREMLTKVERSKVQLTWWEGNLVDSLCRRNRDAIMTVDQKKAALGIIAKYRK